ncbi:MAG TPA: hypothetical protein VEI07_08940 [Planctomycetaceae bacterium]|nr:hypothetical protein [Planctomycetaceae bacterium]
MALCPRRLPLIATALVLVTAAPHVLAVCAEEPAPNPHEAAILDRIFANWKARHDRVHSLHFTWNSRRTSSRRPHFSGKTLPLHRVEKGEEQHQFGVQVFFDGDQRYCRVEPPIVRVEQGKPTDTRRVVERLVIDGDTTWRYVAGPRYLWDRDPPNAHGAVSRTVEPNPTLAGLEGPQALWLTFRPEFPNLSWRRDECRLVDENATVDEVRCVKIQRVIVPKPGNRPRQERRVESLWVSPVREDVVVHWTVEARILVIKGSIRYNKDPKFGWVPSEWTREMPSIHNLEECRVTGYSINETIDPSVFSHQFPPGTPVQDQRGRDKPEGLRHYVVEANGSERAISQQDYVRLGPQPEKKPAAPAK